MRADSGDEAHPHPLRAAAAPTTPGIAPLQSQGSFRSGDRKEFSSKKEKEKKNPAGLQRRPASRPKQQPRSARASHSPTRRCCASTAGAGTTTAARSGPAPTTPRTRPFAAPPPSPPTSLIPPGSLRVFAIFFPFVFGHACGVKLWAEATDTHLPRTPSSGCLDTTPTEQERATGMADTTDAIFHVGGTCLCLTRLCFLAGHRKFRLRALHLLCQCLATPVTACTGGGWFALYIFSSKRCSGQIVPPALGKPAGPQKADLVV